MLPLILAIIACFSFVLAAFNVNHERVSLGWLGAAFLAAAFIFADTFATLGG